MNYIAGQMLGERQQESGKRYFYLALLMGLILHGTGVYFTLAGTYDALVHLFFADHYAQRWFDNWEYRWYTGFTMTSYPPLVHHLMALVSRIIGLRAAPIFISFLLIPLYIRGIYFFSRLWVSEKAAGMACILGVFFTTFSEALHIFGQLPSLSGISLLLNACPELYRWLRYDDKFRMYTALATLAVTSCTHHVTTIFGMVFFILPLMGVAVIDRAQARKTEGEPINLREFIQEAIRVMPRLVVFGFTVIIITATVIFPYWYWSKTDPIAQVSIPHGSRDNFFEVPSSGLVFFLIPWGMMFFFFPYLLRRLYTKRYIFLGLSWTLLFILGTGGTTPIPITILGENAFNILTLDRFTFWATVISVPFWGEFMYIMFRGGYGDYLQQRGGELIYKGMVAFFIIGIFMVNLLVINIRYFQKIQPDPIDIVPITKFLERDQHDEWRYFTLGFGDQMAWLAANTSALSVDGNYHSARRLPEMTTRPVERLENAKYLGAEGIGSVQDFLTEPEKYKLKFIFSNDIFYDPLLYFYGWSKVRQLENNIVVWERPDVPKLPDILPRKEIPMYQRYMWGILPLSCFIIGFSLHIIAYIRERKKINTPLERFDPVLDEPHRGAWTIQTIWTILLALFFALWFGYFSKINNEHYSPINLVEAYFHAIDFKFFTDSYYYYHPDSRPDMEQYQLELSLEGGILSSYAKLDSLSVSFEPTREPHRLEANIEARWITSLTQYYTEHQMFLIKDKGKWYLEYPEYKNQIPPDEFIRIAEIDYYIQGRRTFDKERTSKEDVLDRPNVYISEAALVQRKESYFLVGEMVNLDNDPAFLSVEAVVYDQEYKEMFRNHVKDPIFHTILPKERTAFRIDLFNFVPDTLPRTPKHFVLFVKTSVTSDPIYRFTGWQLARDQPQEGLGLEVLNYGLKEIVVPQLLISYVNPEQQICWVEPHYLSLGIRPQRKKQIDIPYPNMDEIQVLLTGNDDNLIINGSRRNEILAGVNRLPEPLQTPPPDVKFTDNKANYGVHVAVQSYTALGRN